MKALLSAVERNTAPVAVTWDGLAVVAVLVGTAMVAVELATDGSHYVAQQWQPCMAR